MSKGTRRFKQQEQKIAQLQQQLAATHSHLPVQGVAQPHQATFMAQAYSGPIPPPEMLGKFNEVIPDGANLIMVEAETQAKHRRDLERTVIGSDVQRSKNGLWVGLLIVLVSVIAGSIVAGIGQPWAGVGIASVPSVSMVGVFVVGTFSRTSERREKAKAITTGQ